MLNYPTLNTLPACLPVCLSACLPVCLSTCLPVCLPACLPAYLPTFLPPLMILFDFDPFITNSCCILPTPSLVAITEDRHRTTRRSQVEHEGHILSHRRFLLRSVPSHCFPSVPLRTYIPTRCCSRSEEHTSELQSQ